MECCVYRCARQDGMYLYLRADLAVDAVPEPLRRRTGSLTPVMTLQLTPARKLAQADVERVIERLRETGYYLQLPPNGAVQAALYAGD